MSAGCSEVVIDHVSNLPSLQKSVMFLSALLFDIDSFSEVPVRDNLFQCKRYLRIKHFKIGEISPLPWSITLRLQAMLSLSILRS